nr:immunoglobulin heavy chain junction region [Mus musculus]
CTLLYAMDYW